MSKFKLSQSTIEKLNHYVYLLIDPRGERIFYVGKGCGGRIYNHVLWNLKTKKSEDDKNKRIDEIHKLGLEVKHNILRHGLTEEESFKIESSAIDLIGLKNLTNKVNGHHSETKGIMTIEDIKLNYEAEDIEIEDKLLLININNLYTKDMSAKELYEATRKYWKLSLNRIDDIKIVCSVYRGIVREVFSVDRWRDAGERKEFFGKVAQSSIREKYLNKSVTKYWKKGSQNPVKYANPPQVK